MDGWDFKCERSRGEPWPNKWLTFLAKPIPEARLQASLYQRYYFNLCVALLTKALARKTMNRVHIMAI